jgi:hypothetical protein
MDMKTLYLCVIFFLLGAVEDFVISLFYRAIADKRATRAGIISAVHTLLAVFVVASIIKGNSFLPLCAYAAGGGLGTWTGVKRG